MKNKLRLIVLAGALIFVAGKGMADSENKSYFGIQYAVGDFSEEAISKSFNPTALIGRFGYYYRPNISIEARLGVGIEDDTQFLTELGVSGLDASLELDSIIGVYARGHINLTESSSLYGVLGFSRIEATTSIPAFPEASSTSDETSVSYGIGADIAISGSGALNIEYILYLDKDNLDLGVASVGATFAF